MRLFLGLLFPSAAIARDQVFSHRLGSSCALACFLSPAWPLAAPRWLLPPAPPLLLCLVFFVTAARCSVFFSVLSVPPLSLAFSGFRPRVPWALALCFVCFLGLPLLHSPCALPLFVCPAWPLAAPWWLLPTPTLLFLAVLAAAARCLAFFLFFFLFLSATSLSLAFSGSGPRVLWALALCVVCSVGFPLLGSPCALASFVSPAWPLAAPGWLLPPPPPFLCLAVFVTASRCCVPCAVLCCVSLGAVLRPAAACCAARCCAVVCCVVLLRFVWCRCLFCLPSGAARRPGALCFAALCFVVFPLAVCSVLCVFCRGVVVRAVVRRSALSCVCPGMLCCAFPVLSAPCGALPRCAGVLALRCSCGVCWCRRLVLWCAAVCCAVSFGVLWCGAGSGGPWFFCTVCRRVTPEALGVARGCLLVACFGQHTRPAVLTQSRRPEGPDVANPGLVLPLRPTAWYCTAQTVHEVERLALMYYRSPRTFHMGCRA